MKYIIGMKKNLNQNYLRQKSQKKSGTRLIKDKENEKRYRNK